MIYSINKNRTELVDIAALYFFIWSLAPIFGSMILFRLLALFCVCLWFIKKGKILLRDKISIILGAVLILGVSVLEFIDNGLSSSFSWTINRGLYVVGAFIGMYYSLYEKEKIKPFVIISLITIIFVSITSVKTVIDNPNALREATYRYDEEQFRNLASYNFVYLCVLLFPLLLLGFVFIKNHKTIRYITLLTLIITGILILFSGFMIANICLIFSIALFFVLYKPSFIKTLFIISIILVGMILFQAIGKFIFQLLLSLTSDSYVYYRKINGLYQKIFEGGSNVYDIQSRTQLYLDSWKALIIYPIFGSIFLTGKDVTGGHSVLIDIPAAYGWLIGFAFYWFILIKPYKLIHSFKNVNRNLKKMIIFLFIIPVLYCGLFNNYSFSFIWIWYVYIQYLCIELDNINFNGSR